MTSFKPLEFLFQFGTRHLAAYVHGILVATNEVQISFVCQHSHVAVKEASITTRITKQWVKDVAPVIKCAIFLLKVAALVGKFFDGIDFPIKSIEKIANVVRHTEIFWGSGSYSKTVRPNGFLFTDVKIGKHHNLLANQFTKQGIVVVVVEIG